MDRFAVIRQNPMEKQMVKTAKTRKNTGVCFCGSTNNGPKLGTATEPAAFAFWNQTLQPNANRSPYPAFV